MFVAFPNFVDKKKISILLDEQADLRYYIKIPITYSKPVNEKRVLVILKNPSKAKVDHALKIYQSDNTVNRVLSYFHQREYTEVVIVNLFARFYTESEKLNDYIDQPHLIIGESNDYHIQQLIEGEKFERIVVGWGGYPKDACVEMKALYKDRIEKLHKLIKDKEVYYVEKMVENGMFPKHGMIWSLSGQMYPYINQELINKSTEENSKEDFIAYLQSLGLGESSIKDDISRINSMFKRGIDYRLGVELVKPLLNKSNLSDSTIKSCLRLCRRYDEYRTKGSLE